MNKLLLHISLLFIFLLIGNSNINAQTFEELSIEEQKHFFEGYWKYCSTDRDTIFIIKLKSFDNEENGRHLNIGSYLYYNNGMIENNIERLTRYLSVRNCAEYEVIDKEADKYYRERDEGLSLSMFFGSWRYDDAHGMFYDYTQKHATGDVTLSVVSAQKRKEKIHWDLKIEACFLFVFSEEDAIRQTTFSVPTNIVMEKMYDLSEFEDKGIFLSPFPTETLPGLKEEKPARLE